MSLKNRLAKLEASIITKEHKRRIIAIVKNNDDLPKIQEYLHSGYPVTIIKRRENRNEG
jgi:hypothetical protein